MKIEEINDINLRPLTNLVLELWPDCSFESEYIYFKRVLNSEKEICFLVKEDEQYIGFIYLSIRTDYVEGATSSPIAYMEGIYVKPDFRKLGAGNRLVKLGAKWGKQKGCKQYASDTELNNKVSKHFHKKVGFKETNKTVNFLQDIK